LPWTEGTEWIPTEKGITGDFACWSGLPPGQLLPIDFNASFISECESGWNYDITWSNAYQTHTNWLDILALTFSLMTLAYVLTRSLLRLLNTWAERKYGKLMIVEHGEARELSDNTQSETLATPLVERDGSGFMSIQHIRTAAQ
jgi:hypothetical protein